MSTAIPSPKPTGVPELELLQKKSFQRIAETQTDELVVALCGPIGSSLHEVAELFATTASDRYGYECRTIRLSTFIQAHTPGLQPNSNRFIRINDLIKAGNDLRDKHDPQLLAELAVADISHWRTENSKSEKLTGSDGATGVEKFVPKRVCHIIDSIKNQSELDLLRKVYGNILYCIGVFSPLDYRERQLVQSGMTKAEVHTLIDKDSGEENESGQTVRETFPHSDYFLRVDDTCLNSVPEKLERFFDIILGTAIITPSPNETAMYSAATAALNSACLSRQVGASITSSSGKLLSIGWNDVPKFGGNLYRASTHPGADDHRCFRWQYKTCLNDSTKDELSENIVALLIEKKIVPDALKTEALQAIKNSKVGNLIEFSRSIHAEMHAIIMAGQSGEGELRGAKLFCTTYPCHSCARHIIAAGIKEIYFIEPYKKSLAVKLHHDAITEDEKEPEKVKLIPYEGVAPNRYRDLFEMRAPRKEAGKAISTKSKLAHLKVQSSLESLPVLEGLVVKSLHEKQIL